MACRSCRSRKVRCDVADHGIPCCNCKLDHKECTITERRKKRSKHNDHGRPLSPISPSIATDGPSAFKHTDIHPLQPVFDGLMQFSRTEDVTISTNSSPELFAKPSSSLPMPEDPEVSRWLSVMPDYMIKKFQLYFEKVNETTRRTEQNNWKPELETLSRLQKAMGILQEVKAICKSAHSNKGLESPLSDRKLEVIMGDPMDKSCEAGSSLLFGNSDSESVSPCPLTDISITVDGNDGWDQRLMEELFNPRMEPTLGLKTTCK